MSHHSYSRWSEVPPDIWPGKFFSVREFAQRGFGWAEGQTPIEWDDDFISKLDQLREMCRFPLQVSSGYRSPSYNRAVSSTGDSGPHTTGKAVDIAIRGQDALVLLRCAIMLGFTGIGVSQKGAYRFIHLDTLTKAEGYPRPTIWSY